MPWLPAIYYDGLHWDPTGEAGERMKPDPDTVTWKCKAESGYEPCLPPTHFEYRKPDPDVHAGCAWFEITERLTLAE